MNVHSVLLALAWGLLTFGAFFFVLTAFGVFSRIDFDNVNRPRAMLACHYIMAGALCLIAAGVTP